MPIAFKNLCCMPKKKKKVKVKSSVVIIYTKSKRNLFKLVFCLTFQGKFLVWFQQLLLILLHLVKNRTVSNCGHCSGKAFNYQAVAIFCHFAGELSFFKTQIEKLMFILGKEQLLLQLL